MEKVKILAPAKINLFLEVTGKRPDGYHNICSLVEKINLFDEIEVSRSEKIEIQFSSPWKMPEENSVTKTINELSKLYPSAINLHPVRIKIKKNIPPGSGLGGASSDAAGVLKGCNKILNLGMDESQLFEVGSNIGSDVPLFLKDGPCIIEGKGEIVNVIENLPEISFFLFVPDFCVSTKKIYEHITENMLSDLTSARSRIKIFLSLWRAGEIKKMEKLLFNKLEEVTLRIYKEIQEVKNRLEELIEKRFVLTGSGGGVYAIAKKNESFSVEAPEIVRKWKMYKLQSYRGIPQKEEQHGDY